LFSQKKGGAKMRTIAIFFIAMLLAVSAAYCDQKYNPHSGGWETVPDGSNWTNQYNAHDNNWSYQPQDAKIEYNPHESKWDWDSGHNPGSDGN